MLAKNADYASPYLVMPSNSFSIDNILNKTGSSHVLNEEETEPSVQPSQPTAQALSLAVSYKIRIVVSFSFYVTAQLMQLIFLQ